MRLETHDDKLWEVAELAVERGITADVLISAGIGRVDQGENTGWWRIPYPHRQGIWKNRYRNPDLSGRPKYLDSPGATAHLYNPGLLGPGEPVVWFCEGEFDTLSVIDQGHKAIGIHGVGNVPDDEGADSNRFHKSWLTLFEDTLCIVAFDNDDAGRQAGRKLARALNGVVFNGDYWNPDYGDLNEWHKADRDGLGRAMRQFEEQAKRERGMT